VVGHVSPEAALGGPIALIKDGDQITIDAVANTITCGVSNAEMKKRRAAWKAPPAKSTRGVLAKYARTVSSASLGAVTDLDR
jgi:dihydroxy-acid dehydratase